MSHDAGTPLSVARYLDCLAADFERLRAAATPAPTAQVPSCPDWTVTDLVHHVGQVYAHKTQAVLAATPGTEPEWPPKGTADEEPFALLDRAYAELRTALAAHAPEDPSGTWYAPDQTVGFWIRRMAQETVIHRIDAELAAGGPISPVPDDLAVDGIDELLKVFTAYAVTEWSDYFREPLAASPGRTYEVRAEAEHGATWRIRTGPDPTFTVEAGTATGSPDVILSGTPEALLRDLWNRAGADEISQVRVTGAPEAVEELRICLRISTQ
ncbi:maleylpyruvate isomerase family mycothiol-dependent enzyme [Streptomyces sp. NBC_01016]|uniref:maleylpyruvate isomerase family mycothiol-dependent enzyme n=1 Tax=Streptomyces sp. NBC_01016 TaxID=2903720 RepID=UPI00225407BD|nr:maleylpyruvate isomerase family mycothiol-dependent enzyme [Streptomyces sp. NBC_01016]MCX4829426.1 maleylpyruvate isomerase family mycothiol-dependent enzyme [Streptomyces sp. NBC_01016]